MKIKEDLKYTVLADSWNGVDVHSIPYNTCRVKYEEKDVYLYVSDNTNKNGDNNHFSSIYDDNQDINVESFKEIFDYILKNHKFPQKNNIITICIQVGIINSQYVEELMRSNGFTESSKHVVYGPLYEKKII